MQSLADERKGPNYKETMFVGLSNQQLRNIAMYFKGISATTEATREFVDRYGAPKDIDRAFINTYVQNKERGCFLNALQFAETAFPRQVEIEYQAKQILVRRPDQEAPISIPNTFIPLHGKKNRVGMQHLLVTVCSFFDITQGKIVLIHTGTEWKKWFNHSKAQVDFEKLISVRTQLNETLASHPLGEKAFRSRQTVTGPAFVEMMSTVLSECPLPNYWALHTSFAKKFYNAFHTTEADGKTTLRYVMVTDQGKSVYNMGSAFTICRKSDQPAVQKMLELFKEQVGHYPLILTSGVKPVMCAPPLKGITFKNAFNFMRDSNQFRGGSKRGLGLLTSNLGYVNTMTSRTRRAIRIIAMIDASLLIKGKKVDVRIPVGDLQLVIMTYAEITQVDDRLRFVIPIDERTKISDVYHYAINHSQRPDAVLVQDMSKIPPSFSSTQSYDVQGLKHSEGFIKHFGDNICVCVPVLSPLLWDKVDGADPKYKVYPFHKYTSDFACVVTDLPFTICGDVVPPFKSFSDLCYTVAVTNNFMNSYFLNPKSSYSPWVNSLKGPSRAMRCEFALDTGWNVELAPPADDEGPEDDLDLGPEITQVEDDVDLIAARQVQRSLSSSQATSALSNSLVSTSTQVFKKEHPEQLVSSVSPDIGGDVDDPSSGNAAQEGVFNDGDDPQDMTL